MPRTKKRVLWVSFDFPPRQSSGVFRPIRIYKYLDKDLFEVDFLTQSPVYQHVPLDHSLLQEVSPPPRIYRVPNLPLSDFIYRLTRRRRSESPVKPEVAAVPSGEGRRTARRSGLRKLGKKIYVTLVMLFYFPDQYFLWGWLTAFTALGLHFKNRYDLVYTTSRPESAHLVGLVLRPLGVKWVVDYRYAGVLWVKDLLSFRKSRFREWLEFRYQRYVLRKASFVVTQSDTIKEDFCRAFGLDRSHVRTIPSGYDETDFGKGNGSLPFVKHPEEIHLLHVGAAYLDEADQRKMMDELNRVGSGLRANGHDMVLHAIGDDMFPGEQQGNARGFRYHYHGFVTHHALPPYLMAADWYLLSTITTVSGSGVSTNGYLPSKMWEYLRGGKPIVLFGSRDEVWSIIRDAGAGVYWGALDSTHVLSAEELLVSVQSLEPVAAKVRGHSWQARAHDMQEVFTGVLAQEQ